MRKSKTPIDWQEVQAMLQAGWVVLVKWNSELQTYVASAKHYDDEGFRRWNHAKEQALLHRLESGMDAHTVVALNNSDFDTPGEVVTDDFTPAQALTRLAYKVAGKKLEMPS